MNLTQAEFIQRLKFDKKAQARVYRLDGTVDSQCFSWQLRELRRTLENADIQSFDGRTMVLVQNEYTAELRLMNDTGE